MKSISQITHHELIIKKSRFLTTLIPCNNLAQADQYIAKYRQKYSDATHNTLAYIIDHNEKADDDGEPSGTAGLPMLNVLKKQNLSNILVIVTRYFGGIKLGAGGLNRAYSQAVAQALLKAKIVEKIKAPLYQISIDYSYTKQLEYLLRSNQIEIIDIKYDLQVIYHFYCPDKAIIDQICELTANNFHQEIIQYDYIEKK